MMIHSLSITPPKKVAPCHHLQYSTLTSLMSVMGKVISLYVLAQFISVGPTHAGTALSPMQPCTG